MIIGIEKAAESISTRIESHPIKPLDMALAGGVGGVAAGGLGGLLYTLFQDKKNREWVDYAKNMGLGAGVGGLLGAGGAGALGIKSQGDESSRANQEAARISQEALDEHQRFMQQHMMNMRMMGMM